MHRPVLNSYNHSLYQRVAKFTLDTRIIMMLGSKAPNIIIIKKEKIFGNNFVFRGRHGIIRKTKIYEISKGTAFSNENNTKVRFWNTGEKIEECLRSPFFIPGEFVFFSMSASGIRTGYLV